MKVEIKGFTCDLVTGFKDDEALRGAFNDLTEKVFGFRFESWYQAGYWNERYQPYALMYEGQMVANASANMMDLRLEGRPVKGIQIGTVMTHPDFRKKGLGAYLMNHIEKTYRHEADILYLFANDSATDFYRKLGFDELTEYEFSAQMDDRFGEKLGRPTRKLDLRVEHDKVIVDKLIKHRTYLSQGVGVKGDFSLLGFYILLEHGGNLYYSSNHDCIFIATLHDDELILHDIISESEVHIDKVTNEIYYMVNRYFNVEQDRRITIRFGFKPCFGDDRLVESHVLNEEDSTTFVKNYSELALHRIRFPKLSHA